MEDLLTPLTLVLLAAAFLGGFVDSIAGGGGLIVVPALLLTGMPPIEALGTNKLQGLFGSGSAAVTYAGRGHVDLKSQVPVALLCFLGAIVGAVAASRVPAEILRGVMPFLLIAIALYFALRPNLGDIDGHRRIGAFAFGAFIAPAIGFYDGLFGPGAGSFYMLAFVALAGFGVLKATARTKLLNFGSNVGGFVAFAMLGAVRWELGLLMGVCQILGGRTGALFAIKKGAKLIKPVLVITCVALAIRLLLSD